MNDLKNPKIEETTSHAMTFVSSLSAIAVCVVVIGIGGVAFSIFDSLRGLESDTLQRVFREFFVPGVGGFAGMYAAARFRTGSLRGAFWLFSGGMIAISGGYLWFVGSVANEIGVSTTELVYSSLTLIAPIVGADIAIRQIE